MKKKIINDVRLGIFIISGLLILVVSLYMIGQNHSFFGSSFLLKARFRDVSGLMSGNNVRFSGIQCGTVTDIEIIDDTTIQVSMLVSEKTSAYIRSDARATIGTEGLMGNKVINIMPGKTGAPAIADGGTLYTDNGKGLNDLMGDLSATGGNALVISAELKATAERLNNSRFLTDLLTDTLMAGDIREALLQLKNASQRINRATVTINDIVAGVEQGGGVVGALLTDRQAGSQMLQSVERIHHAAGQVGELIGVLDSMVADIRTNLQEGAGPMHMLLRDTSAVKKLQGSLDNIEKGTAAFNEDMEALKHNFLLRAYFRKLERKQKK